MKLLTGNKLQQSIDRVLKQAANLRVNLHMVAVSCMVECADNDNGQYFEQVLNTLPASERVNKLKKWARSFFDVSITRDDETGQYTVEAKSDDYDLELAVATPYYSLISDEKAKQPPRDVESLFKALDRFMSPTNEGDVSPEATALAFEIVAKFKQFKKYVK